MEQPDRATLVAMLRKALETVQDSSWRESDALTELKRDLLRAIAELEAQTSTDL